jgi:hypothetical protein
VHLPPVSLLFLGALALACCNCPSYFRPFQGRFVDGVGAPVAGNVVTSTDDGGALHSAKTDKDGVFHVPAIGVKSGHGYGGNEACMPQTGHVEPGSRVCKLPSGTVLEIGDGDGELDLGTRVLNCTCAAGTHSLGTHPETCAAD